MSLFKQFETNTAKEIEGVPVYYGPNDDGTIPTFYISRMGKSNKKYNKVLDRVSKPYASQLSRGTIDNKTAENIMLTSFVAGVVKGWENVFDRDGNEITFSEDAARKLFEQLPDLYEDLTEKAKTVALFRDEDKEDDAKN